MGMCATLYSSSQQPHAAEFQAKQDTDLELVVDDELRNELGLFTCQRTENKPSLACRLQSQTCRLRMESAYAPLKNFPHIPKEVRVEITKLYHPRCDS
jgi:hypothetical protein